MKIGNAKQEKKRIENEKAKAQKANGIKIENGNRKSAKKKNLIIHYLL